MDNTLESIRQHAATEAIYRNEGSMDLMKDIATALGTGRRAIIDAAQWKAEAEYWKAKYDALTLESIRTSEATGLGIIQALIQTR
jgi:hypothetical protein